MLKIKINKKKKCRGANGVSYYPFPVLCHNTTVVSRPERHSVHYRSPCAHDQGPARARLRVKGKARRDRPPWVLCHDREFSTMTELAHPVSRQGSLGLR